MIITNRNRLPDPLVAAVSQTRPPEPDRISVTTLIGPPQIRVLQLQHWQELTEDASDRIWATMGSLMHKLLESHAPAENHQAEVRLETQVEGITVTGAFDLFHKDGVLTDYKFVSVWSAIGGVKAEWIAQLNLYAELLRRTGANVRRLEIVAIYRDWSKNRAFEYSYPNSQVQIFEIDLWTSEQASEFMAEHVRLHLAAQAGEVVECSAEERWERPTKYALMKRGNKKAVKLYATNEEATAAVKQPDHYVELRPGANVRCESYCSVSAFCPQYAKLKGGDGDHADDRG
jgi:hypothetical protein